MNNLIRSRGLFYIKVHGGNRMGETPIELVSSGGNSMGETPIELISSVSNSMDEATFVDTLVYIR